HGGSGTFAPRPPPRPTPADCVPPPPMAKIVLIPFIALPLFAQTAAPGQPPAQPPAQAPAAQQPNAGNDEVLKRVDDLMWHLSLGDIAAIDKIEYTSLPPARIPNPKAPGATN